MHLQNEFHFATRATASTLTASCVVASVDNLQPYPLLEYSRTQQNFEGCDNFADLNYNYHPTSPFLDVLFPLLLGVCFYHNAINYDTYVVLLKYW